MKIPIPGRSNSVANSKESIVTGEFKLASGMRVALGFSLIEIVIALAIMSILVGIALPMYQGYVLRSHRTIVHSEMLNILTRQEIYYVENRQYGTLQDLRYDANIVGIAKNGNIVAEGLGIYDLQMKTAQPAGNYLVKADATGIQLADSECLEITLDLKGSREKSECW
ncbi:MAG: type IV pilus assembly protein PilE [bacterium]|jgi:type IV pilus assembly protein PilE